MGGEIQNQHPALKHLIPDSLKPPNLFQCKFVKEKQAKMF